MIPVYCPLCCDQPFEDQQALFFHLRGLRNNLFCPICSERFGSLEYLVSHLSRKCYGPVSAPEAKRKCSLNNPTPDGVAAPTLAPPSDLKPTKSLGDTHNKNPAPIALEETSSGVCNSVDAASPVPVALIPSEIKNKISKSVTLSIGSVQDNNVTPQQNTNCTENPLNVLLDKMKLIPATSDGSNSNSLLNSILTKVPLKPSVEISVGASQVTDSKTPENSLVSVPPKTNSLSDIPTTSGSSNSNSSLNSILTKVSLNPSVEISVGTSQVTDSKSPEKSLVSVPPKTNSLSDIPTTSGGSNSNSSLNSILTKVSLNPSVEISVGTSQVTHSKSPEKSLVSVPPKTKSPSVSIITNDLQSLSPPKKSRKAGPLSSKVKNSISSLSPDKSLELKKPEELPKDENKEPKAQEPSEKKVQLNSVPKDESFKLPLQNKEKKRSRGRPRKHHRIQENDLNPVMNGAMGNKTESTSEPLEKQTNNYTETEVGTGEETNNNRSSIKTRKKNISSIIEKLKDLDDDEDDDGGGGGGDHFEESAFQSSDEDYQPDEPLSSVKKKVENTKIKQKQINNEHLEKTKSETTTEPKTNSSNEEPKKSSLEEGSKAEEEEEYTCSACDVRFTSIYEHIKQYHNGEEVVVEVPEEEIKEDLKAYQDDNERKISIGESESTNTCDVDYDTNIPDSSAQNKDTVAETSIPVFSTEDKQTAGDACVKNTTDKIEKKETMKITGFTAGDICDDLVYTKTFKKVKKKGEQWVQSFTGKRSYYQFVTDEDKYMRIVAEVKNNKSIHPEMKISVKDLFEDPKINVVEISYQPNSPFFTHRLIDLRNPLPLYIVERKSVENHQLLGSIASYVISKKKNESASYVPDESKLIGVMKVILASDRELTVENIVFNDKPASEYMVPVLEDVKDPEIPLLKNAKLLKWRCNKCMSTTWKFPTTKETHCCNACPICHKTFASPVSLKKHVVLHKRDGTKYCRECRAAFISKVNLNSHLLLHKTHSVCEECHLFVPIDLKDDHSEIHERDPSEQFPCSICKKMFGSDGELKGHETQFCSRLVARFNCHLCDKKFFSRVALSYHTNNHNRVVKQFSCRFCSKSFIQEKEQCRRKAGKRKPSSSIQKLWHERIHTRDRPYMCVSCPKRFRSSDHHQSHGLQVHSAPSRRDIPIHMCVFCDRVFSNNNQLESHLAQHTKEAVTNSAK